MSRTSQLVGLKKMATGQLTAYTCPPGMRTIVKSIAIQDWSAGASVHVYLFKPAGLAIQLLVLTTTTSSTQLPQIYLEVWVVMVPGDTLVLDTSLPDVDFLISGTELDV